MERDIKVIFTKKGEAGEGYPFSIPWILPWLGSMDSLPSQVSFSHNTPIRRARFAELLQAPSWETVNMSQTV